MPITKREQDHITEYIADVHSKRRGDRAHTERVWKEIDRQLAMEPDCSHKKTALGLDDPNKAWMPETELPWQSETLEISTADARRMEFPDSGPWYAAHAALTDEYLDRVDYSSIITGDENDVPSKINQDNADKLVQGVVDHWHRQYDFAGNIDLINAEAFKYGMGVGRGRIAQKTVFSHTSRGVEKQSQRIPVLVPRSIKNTYLDTSEHHLMAEGHIVGPGQIFEKTMKLKDLQMASIKGSTDPNSESGGWLKANLKKIEPDANGNVKILEWEGDMVIPKRTAGSTFLPQGIFTMVMSEGVQKLIRVRKNQTNSYLLFPYHSEHIDTPYGTSPCIKGYPIQMAAAQTMNRMMEAGQLDTQPPIGYDRDDQEFAASGGPRVFPGAQWGTLGEVKVHDIGNAGTMGEVFSGLWRMYQDVTGTTAPRLGAQTISHTTKFAKQAELSQGTVRTVDYVRNSMKGPIQRWLDMEYKMGRDVMGKSTLYIDAYRGFVTITKDHLPDLVMFEAFGAGGPAEEQAKKEARRQSLNEAIQLDITNHQISGEPRRININAAIEHVLSEGGWADIDPLLSDENVESGQVDPGVASTALQTLAFGR